MTKNEVVAGAIAVIMGYAIGWLSISKQEPIPGLDQLSAIIVTGAIVLLAYSYFKRNPL